MEYLAHHGIEGQKWGKRNGPPYPLGYSDHSSSELKYAKGLSALKLVAETEHQIKKQEKNKEKTKKQISKAKDNLDKEYENYRKTHEKTDKNKNARKDMSIEIANDYNVKKINSNLEKSFTDSGLKFEKNKDKLNNMYEYSFKDEKSLDAAYKFFREQKKCNGMQWKKIC